MRMDEASKVDESCQYLQLGKTVNVQWRAQWHRGTVIQLGPQPNLLKLKDIASDATILLETRNVKLMEANTLDKQFYVGRRVGYHDNDEWKEAVIVSNKAIGDVLVQWRKSEFEPYKQNWFQNSNVMLHDEDREDNDDVAKSAIVEPITHFPGSMSTMPLPQIPQSQPHYGLYSSIHASPTYESMRSMLSQQPAAPQMMFLHPAIHSYRPWHIYNHFHRLRTGLDPTGMETMSLPGLRSNPTHSGGIPPHVSSHFFQDLYLRHQKINNAGYHHASPVHSSSSVPKSDPVPYAELKFNPRTQSCTQIPTADQNLKSHRHPSRHMPLKRPNPYEKPQPSRTNLQLDGKNSVGDKHEEKRQSLCIQFSSPAEIRVEVDGSALLSVIVNVSDSSFTWYKNEERLLGAKNISFLAPNLLHLQHATKSDAGEYKCVISCEPDTITYTCKVVVFSSLPDKSASKEASEIAFVQQNLDPEQQNTTEENEPMNAVECKLDISSRNQSISMDIGDDATATDAQRNNIILSNESILMTEPVQIDVSKRSPRIQRRISAVLKTDIQDYLQGYGENYGETSSSTNMTEEVQSYLLSVGDNSLSPTSPTSTHLTEQVQQYVLSVGDKAPTSQPEESIAKGDKIVTFPLQNSSSLHSQTDMNSNAPNSVQRSKKGFFHHFKKEKVTKNSDTDASTSGIQSDATTQNELASYLTPLQEEKAEQLLDNISPVMNSEPMTDNDSINVNTSLDDSSGSEKASLNEHFDASLPLESESVAELVKKLQMSTEAHTPQYVIQKHLKKKTFVSNLFHGKTKQSQ